MDSFNTAPPSYSPKNILVIRLHSVGDVAITFPYCSALKNTFPGCNIDYLTREDISVMPAALDIFRRAFYIDLTPLESSNPLKKLKKLYRSFRLASVLKTREYDVVIDLQNNRISNIILNRIKPKYFSKFDRLSDLSASERTRNTFKNAGFDIVPRYRMKVNPNLMSKAKDTLIRNGWDISRKIFVLNPAGLWKTRNWQIENYVRLARLISYNHKASFILLGDKRMLEKANYISSYLTRDLINLVDKTTLAEAFAILQFATATISEDSGLMHMSWVSGIPTLTLLGSSRADWTTPNAPHTITLNSSDLDCGDCMSPVCKYNDVHCLTRYSPEYVYDCLKKLL